MGASHTQYNRVYVYVDGFNLYYCALKNRTYPSKWLNLKQLVINLFPSLNLNIEKIKYFTADVSGKVNSSAPKEQAAYLKALRTLKEIEIIKGRFSVHENFLPLAFPVEFRPNSTQIILTTSPSHVKIVKYEEKGSDVNLGCHLVKDTYTDKFDLAIIITDDTDLCLPIEMVKKENKQIKLVSSKTKTPTHLYNIVSQKNIAYTNQRIIQTSQFPSTITDTDGDTIVIKPSAWL